MDSSRRILLVTECCKWHEDVPLVLSHAGYDVVEPRVPSEAMRVLETDHIDLVLIGHCVQGNKRDTLVQLITSLQPTIPIVCVAGDAVPEQKTSGSITFTSCATMVWAIEHALANPRST
jgi:DNA-binding NtrC family response regulator